MNATNPSNDGEARTVIAAGFADRESAHDAARRLHDEGFRDTWIGIARQGDHDDAEDAGDRAAATATRIEPENWFQRFFGEGGESLHDALVRRGVGETDAAGAQPLANGGAVLTVDGANHPELAVQIISGCGGTLLSRGFGVRGYGTGTAGTMRNDALSGSDATLGSDTNVTDTGLPSGRKSMSGRAMSGDAARSASSSEATVDNTTDDRYATDLPMAGGYADYGRYRGGDEVDDSRRIQLREERLSVDKARRSREAVISKDVETEQQSFDVPVTHEELYVERRPVRNGAEIDANTIGSDAPVRISLSEERVNVSKVPVVSEEVTIGKRTQTETEHVAESTRKERLNVQDAGRS